MKLVVLAFVALCISGCATAQTPKPIDLSTLGLAKFTHADLQNAAALAAKAGHPERAAVWSAKDAVLSAYEAQASACLNAIAASVPKPVSPGGTVGAATLVELADEAVGQLAPASTVITCKVIP